MPMLELSPGDEHQGIVRVGSLVRRDDIGGDEPRFPGRGWERLHKHDGLTGIAFLHTRVGDAVLGLESFPRDAANAGHRMAHLIEYLSDCRLTVAVGPVETELARHVDNDLEILARLAGGLERLATDLHEAIGVGETAGLL